MDNKEVVFYCFNDSIPHNQKSNVIKCVDLQQAHNLFDIEYAKQKEGKSEWTYFDITINGKLLRSSNK